MKNFFFFSIFFSLLISCSEEDKRQNLLPNVTGQAGEIVIILDDKYKETELRETVEKCFLQTHIGLPQEEPVFNIIVIPSHAFKNIFEKHRNVINIDINSKYTENNISVKKDVWAKPQSYMSITASSDSSFIQLITESETKMLSFFIESERSRLQAIQQRTPNLQAQNKLSSKHNLSLKIPSAYKYDTDSSDFVWISYETPQISQGIFIYHYPYLSTDMLEKESLIAKRNEFLQKYVPGPRENSFMTTETLAPTYHNVGKMIDGKYTVELRGLWKVKGDYMGGPFLSYTTIDEERNRVVTIEGYVYAPKFKKRNYLRQVEAIIRTLKIEKTDKE